MSAPASRTSSRRMEPFPVFENKSAFKAFGRLDDKFQRRPNALSHMVQMVQDLFHGNMYLRGQLLGCI